MAIFIGELTGNNRINNIYIYISLLFQPPNCTRILACSNSGQNKEIWWLVSIQILLRSNLTCQSTGNIKTSRYPKIAEISSLSNGNVKTSRYPKITETSTKKHMLPVANMMKYDIRKVKHINYLTVSRHSKIMQQWNELHVCCSFSWQMPSNLNFELR